MTDSRALGASIEREKYEAMPDEAIKALVDEARKADIETYEAIVHVEEAKPSFNQPNAVADLAYWAQLASWTLDEAVCGAPATEVAELERVRN